MIGINDMNKNPKINMTRKNGFYWVKRFDNWMICEWDNFGNMSDKFWFIPGFELRVNDSDFEEIDETPITRPEKSNKIGIK